MPFNPSYKNSKGKEIDLYVLVYTRPNLRDDGMLTHVGYNIIENLFDKCEVKKGVKEMGIVYPERWSNLLEQRAMLERIIIFYPDIEKIRIATHSVYIIQCTHSSCIGICDDASKYPEKDYGDINVRYCPKQQYDGSLMVLHG